MEIPLSLAMTAVELSGCGSPPAHMAWMSCRFSPGGKCLSNLPPSLPTGSLLILDDQTPPDDHDADLIRKQLIEAIDANHCSGLLLDFQRPKDPQTAKITAALLSLPCPVCVSHLYAKELPCAVLPPPCPLTKPLKQHLAPWQGREIWLDIALDSAVYRISKTGCDIRPAMQGSLPYYDEELFCHYGIRIDEDQILFSLERQKTGLPALMTSAAELGVTKAIGLYQELSL